MKRQHINMDNYEEYFLLYVDNELTAAEKASVEEFVKQHPELRPELDMFLDTRLDPDTIMFTGKDELLKTGDVVNADNFEELQVQMLDGELDAQKCAELEAYHLTHTKAAENFEWLKKTKLPVESIIFPDKASLYRKERKPATIISITWVRIAVAASVVLIAGLLWFQQNNDNVEIVSEPQLASQEKALPSSVNNGNTASNEKGADQLQTKGTIETASAATQPVIKENGLMAAKKIQQELNKEQPVTYATVERNTNMNEDLRRTETYTTTVETIAEKPVMELGVSETASPREALAMNVKTNYVSEALETDHTISSDDYAEEEQGKRKGFRGLVRKVNRFYNKATNPDPEKAVVKVASFEIGLPR